MVKPGAWKICFAAIMRYLLYKILLGVRYLSLFSAEKPTASQALYLKKNGYKACEKKLDPTDVPQLCEVAVRHMPNSHASARSHLRCIAVPKFDEILRRKIGKQRIPRSSAAADLGPRPPSPHFPKPFSSASRRKRNCDMLASSHTEATGEISFDLTSSGFQSDSTDSKHKR